MLAGPPCPEPIHDNLRDNACTIEQRVVCPRYEAFVRHTRKLSHQVATRGKWKARLPELIDALEAIGRVHAVGGGWVAAC